MSEIVFVNQADATKRRMYFQVVDATDGMTAETGEAGGQPQVSVNGAAWTNTGIGTLVHIGNGRYYGQLTQALVSTVGDTIEGRYKSVNTAEIPAVPVQVMPVPSVGIGATTVTLTIQESDGDPVVGAGVWITTDAGGSNRVAGTEYTDAFGHVTFYLDPGSYFVWRQKAGWSPPAASPNPQHLTVA